MVKGKSARASTPPRQSKPKTDQPKGPKADVAPKEPKATTQPKTPKGNPRAKPGNNFQNLTPDEVRALFLSNRQKYIAAVSKIKAAEKARDEVVTEFKADGFTKKQFDISLDLADLKKEKKVKADVTVRLQVARWIGHEMGRQADLFEELDRTPSVDRAYDEGKQASMEGKPRKPRYDSSVPQYGAWMSGFDDHQRELHGGFKALENPRPDQVENKVAQMAERAGATMAADSPRLGQIEPSDDDDDED